MHKIINGLYDGKGNISVKPKLDFPPETKLRIQIISQPDAQTSFLDVAESLQLKGPEDWSEKIDEYLYSETYE